MAAPFTHSTANLIPGMMALGMVGHTVKMIPKDWGPKGMQKFDSGKSTKNLIGGFTGIMMGVPMIRVVSSQVAAL